ncbi:MAG: nucleotide exchange factor GrpE [Anaerolineae bacterium]
MADTRNEQEFTPERDVEQGPGSQQPAEAPAEAAAEAPAREAENLARLQAALEEARKQADEYLDQWRRSVAEFSNYRKRVEKERQEFAQQANARLISRLLVLLDDFERAFATLPPALMNLTWIEGLHLIYRKLQVILEGEGLEAMETVGKPFDPLEHEAVTYEEVEGVEDGQVIGEVQKGYRLHGRVLRPALVRVARIPAREPIAAQAPAEPAPSGAPGGPASDGTPPSDEAQATAQEPPSEQEPTGAP